MANPTLTVAPVFAPRLAEPVTMPATPPASAPAPEPAPAIGLADALRALERLPLTPDERAAVLRHLMAESPA